MIEKTRGGFLVSRIKQVQGRIFEKLLKESGIEEIVLFDSLLERVLNNLKEYEG